MKRRRRKRQKACRVSPAVARLTVYRRLQVRIRVLGRAEHDRPTQIKFYKDAFFDGKLLKICKLLTVDLVFGAYLIILGHGRLFFAVLVSG